MGGRGSGSGIKKLNNQGAAALNYYVSGEGMWINQYLRGRGDFGELDASEKQFIKDLDSITQDKITNDTLYRTVDAEAIFGKLDDAEYDDLKQEVVYNAFSGRSGAYSASIAEKVNALINNTIGKEITEKGFMSTTKDLSIAQDNLYFFGSEKPVVLELKTNKNVRGADVMKYANNATRQSEEYDPQKEVLLKRNTKYKINKVEAKNGSIYIKATIL